MDLEALADKLRPDLEEVERRERELLAQLEEVRDDRRRLTRAMDALTSSMKRPGRPRNGSKKKADPWMPSDDLRERIQAFVDANPEGVTVKDAQDATGISKTGADRTLRVLRQEEAIRMAGRKPGSTAILYKPQPHRGAMNGGS